MKKIIQRFSRGRLLAALLALVLTLSLVPFSVLLASSASAINPLYEDNGAEGDSSDIPTSLTKGEVWTGKKVEVTSAENGLFDVTLSALGGAVTTHSKKSADIVFVLDASTSMKESDFILMVKAANSAIDAVMSASSGNRVGVVCFSDSADTLLSLGRYTSTDAKYIKYDNAHISITNTASVVTGSGGSFGSSVHTGGYTNIQAALITAYNSLNVTTTNTPAIVLMSDGGATKYTKNYNATSLSGLYWHDSFLYGDHTQFTHTAAYYTIRTANNIKALLGSDSLIYTIGYNLGSDKKVATATLNPTTDNINATSSLLFYFDDTLNELLGTGDFAYNDGYYTGNNTTGLETAMLDAVGEITSSSSPITGNLVMTDTVGSSFNFVTDDVDFSGTYTTSDTLAFTLDGSPQTAYYDTTTSSFKFEDTSIGGPTSGVTVIFNTFTREVIYTIPADVLKTVDTADSVDYTLDSIYNSVVFSIRLSDNATNTDVKYYTNYSEPPDTDDYGCFAEFTPTMSNPFYGYVPESSTTTGPVTATYTNVPAVDGYWQTPSTELLSGTTPVMNCSYIAEQGHNKNTFPYNWIVDIPESLTITNVSVGDIIFTDGISKDSGDGYSNNRHFKITVNKTIETEGVSKIVANFSFYFYPNKTNKIKDVNGTIKKYTWVPTTPGITQFNVVTTPIDVGSTASVTALVSGTTYTGTTTDFNSPTSWSFTTTVQSSTYVSRLYTITLNCKTLTVSYTETTVTPAHWTYQGVTPSGTFTQEHRETGWIQLANKDGDLKISKQLVGGDPDKEFTFAVSLTNNTSEETAASLYRSVYDSTNNSWGHDSGTPIDIEAMASFTLGNNDYISITGIKHNASFVVTETEDLAYTTTNTIASSNIATGTIAGGRETDVLFTNTYKVANLTIGKSVIDDKDAEISLNSESYNFTVIFDIGEDVYNNIDYPTGYTAVTNTLTLTAGESATFGNIPVGTLYTVTETTSDGAIVSHRIDDGQYVKGNTATGEIGITDCVQYRNDYTTPAPLTISKVVTAYDNSGAPDTFEYDIYFYNFVTDEDAVAAAEVALGILDTAKSNLVLATDALALAQSDYDTATAALSTLESELLILSAADPTDPIAIAAKETEITAAQLDLSDKETALNTAQSDYDEALLAVSTAQADYDIAAAAAEPQQVPYSLTESEIPASLTATGVDGHYTFTLNATPAQSDSISFVNLPVDLYYEVTEAATTPVARNVTIDPGPGSTSGMTATGRILWDGVEGSDEDSISVIFTNDYSITRGELELTKQVNENAPYWRTADNYSFTITFDQPNVINDQQPMYHVSFIDGEQSEPASTPSSIFDITLYSGQSAYFSNLLPGTTYTVTENTTGMDSVTIGNGTTSTQSNTFTGTMALSADGYTVAPENVTCLNTYNPPVTTVDKRADNTSVTTGATVKYTIDVAYDFANDVSSIDITDEMFPRRVNDSFTIVSMGSATLDTTKGTNGLTWNGDKVTLYLAATDDYESTSNTVTVSYSVTLTQAGTYNNTATAEVFYHPEYSRQASDTETVKVTDPYIPYYPPVTTSPSASPSASPSPSPSESPSPSTGDDGDASSSEPSSDIGGDIDFPDDSDVAGDADILPQTGGISTSTLLGIFGLALLAIGGTTFTLLRKKNHGNSK